MMFHRSFVAYSCVSLILAVLSPASPTLCQTLLQSTFFGGSGSENVNDLAVDAQGNIYVVGYTESGDLPMMPDSWDPTFSGAHDVYVACFNADLSELLAATYLGGDDVDHAYRVEVEPSGTVLVSGFTESTDFQATAGAYSQPGGGVDGFVARLDHDLTDLLAMARIGGSNSDFAYALCLGAGGSVYLAGESESSDLPVTSGAYATEMANSDPGQTDFFVHRFSADLSTLEASTYLGGGGIEIFADLGLDSDGNLLLLGATRSANFPTTAGVWDSIYNGYTDVVLARLDPDLGSLLTATFLGGYDYDRPANLLQGQGGDIFLAGYTHSSNFPTTLGAYDRSYNGYTEGFVSRLSVDFSTLEASSLLGRNGTEYCMGNSLALRGDGTVCLSGATDGNGFPATAGAIDDSYNGGMDLFISCLDPSLQTLDLSTFWGGSGDEWGSVWVTDEGDFLAAGSTSSTNFIASTGVYCEEYNAGGDAFLTRLAPPPVASVGTGPDLPASNRIESVRPNPFNPGTEVRFRVENPGRMSVRVYDLKGQLVDCLASGDFTEGEHRATWDGRDAGGRLMPSGSYLLALRGAGTSGRSGTVKIQLVR